MSSALEYAHANRTRFLEELKDLLRIPSISTLPEHTADMQRAALWLYDRLSTIGIPAKIIPGDGHPLVYGEWLQARGKPTILIYGHYDVQPVDPLDLWKSPPFEPVVRNGNLYARGASDDKGQTMTLLYAAESLLQTEGALPVNVKVLIEGEEEAGGGVVTDYVKQNSGLLQADFAQVADSAMFAPGIPAIETGLRGIVYTEIVAQGASQDLHSGLYGGVAPNPFVTLAQVISGLKDTNGHITIAGFYDDVRMPEVEVLESWRSLPFDEERFRRDEVGAAELVGEGKYTPLERMWARPTLDVHGMPGGFTGTGAKTVIPARASAKISMRLVPDQRADTIFELFQQRVLELAQPGVFLEIHRIVGGDPVVIPTDSVHIGAARGALEATFGRTAVLGRSGGSIPIVGTFKEQLGMNSVLMGWGLPDDNLHAPNEKLSLENFFGGIDATIRFWNLLGTMAE
jgi:acetylornithine deacetylase/succinyl-diaminopimelate desuccinylase-like protein